MELKEVFYIWAKAPSDINGNPQRLFLVYATNGQTIAVVDEGYRGDSYVKKHYPDAYHLDTIGYTVKSYRDEIKFAKERGIFVDS